MWTEELDEFESILEETEEEEERERLAHKGKKGVN